MTPPLLLPRTIREWLGRIDKDSKEARDRRIFDLWLACWTQEEIADAVDCTRDEVRGVRDVKFGELGSIADFPKDLAATASHAVDFDPPLYNIWQQQEKTAGASHFGAAINREVEAAQSAFRDALNHALAAGDLLIEAKSHVAHGDWTDWIAMNTTLSRRSAQGYMRLADNRPAIEEAQRVAHLGIGEALRLLAQPRDDSPTPLLEAAYAASELVLEEIERALDVATTVEECVRIAAAALDLQQQWTALRLRYERAAGSLIRDAERAP